MKKFVIAAIAALLAAALPLAAGCTDAYKKYADRINENADFELGFLKNSEMWDLSLLVHEDGWFGAEAYYNSGYTDGDMHYVKYIVTAYPDYADGGAYVTQIICTDPEVTFFNGCTIGDCEEMFDYLSEQGFEITNTDDVPCSVTTAGQGSLKITRELEKSVGFYYEVSNREGIDF